VLFIKSIIRLIEKINNLIYVFVLSGEQSRSWNRIYADFIFQYENYYLSFKPWYQIESTGSLNDNPDIVKYMGHGEVRAAYAGGKHTLSIMLRNNFRNPSYGALEINWSFPNESACQMVCSIL